MATAENVKSVGLIRGLSLWAAIAVVIGAMIGQAVFLVASDVAQELGSTTKVLAAWLIAGILVLLGTFCFAELGAAMPEAGGEYVYLKRGLGPAWGFLYGWTCAMILRPGSAAVIAAGLLRFTSFLLPSVGTPLLTWQIWTPFQPYLFTLTAAQPLAAAVIVVVTGLNYVGIRTAGRLQILLTSFKVTAVAAIVILGLLLGKGSAIQPVFTTSSAHPGLSACLIALVPIMAAYNGFSILGYVGGEVVNPRRNLPRAAILGVTVVISLYLLLNWVYFHVLGFARVSGSLHVASDAMYVLLGRRGAQWLTLAMIVSALGTLHVNFLGGPRVPYAMARDGCSLVLPNESILHSTHPAELCSFKVL